MEKIKEFFSDVNWICEIIAVAVFGLLVWGMYLLFLPAIPGWGFFGIILAAFIITAIVFCIICNFNYWTPAVGTLSIICAVLTALFMLVSVIGGAGMFHSETYKNSIKPQEVQTHVEDIPSFDDVDKIALMDTDSARKLGDRTLGGLSEYVSQFNVAYDYTTISYKGNVMKIAPLEHAGFFKAMKNDTIPGYVIVNCHTNEASFVKVEGGIKYSPSAFFGKDLLRHIRSQYKNLLGNYYNFQIDEEGNPYWVVTVYEYSTWFSAKVPVGAIVVNAVNGEMNKYSLNEIPEWVEQVCDGDAVTMLYNRHGKYINGAFNFSDTGKTQVTEDYGYIEKNGDIYIYTGVTSVAADESNIGFLMVNSRTAEAKYYPIPGAEEYSAMSAAEGVVQNFGYNASFPSLVMYGETPTYVMVLKDANGLVKKYAMVNMVNYTIVAVEDTLDECKEAYVKVIEKGGADTEVDENAEKISKVIVVDTVKFIPSGGETTVFVKDTEGNWYKQNFADNEKLILLEVGKEVTVEYTKPADIIKANFKF